MESISRLPAAMESVDVFIPYHRKDRIALPHTVASIRRHLTPRVNRVVCVGMPLEAGDQAAVEAAGGIFVDERSLTEIPHPTHMETIIVRGENRTGWYYQQLLKWGFRTITETPSYVVWDADSILITPLSLWENGCYVLELGNYYHEPYFTCFEKLFGWKPEPADSFVINYQIIDVKLLEAMIADIEKHHDGKKWVSCILDNIDRTETSGFSEFETYGSWMSRFHPDKFTTRVGKNYCKKIRWLFLRSILHPRLEKRGYTTVSYHQIRGR